MHRDKVFLLKILEDIKDIEAFSQDVSYDKFLSDKLIKKAVCMSLINIGESVKGLSKNIKAEYNSVPWKKASGLRDIVAHKYGTIDFEIIWQTIIVEIPSFKKEILKLLNII